MEGINEVFSKFHSDSVTYGIKVCWISLLCVTWPHGYLGSGAQGEVKTEGRFSSIGMVRILGWQAAEASDAEV